MEAANRYYLPAVCAIVLAGGLAGCSGSDVSAPVPEKYPPEKAGEVALQTYDANNDGKISGAELDECLALKYSLAHLDANGDKGLSADEIGERIRALEEQSPLTAVSVQIVSRQGPVSGATAVFELEPFMGPDLPEYTMTTDQSGGGPFKLQGTDEIVVGIPLGFYRVTISAPGGEVVRGCEIADDLPTANRVVFSMENEAPVGGGGGRFGGR